MKTRFLSKAAVTVSHYLAPLTTGRSLTLSPPFGWLPLAVGLALLSVLLIPLNLLATQPFHHDEALYATWAMEIASGRNPWLKQAPIDKPPLFLYAAAGSIWLLGPTEAAARLPSLLATMVTVGLTFWLGRKLYGPGVGLLAAWLVALSPFTILFAPTAFTDSLLVALVLAACLAAVSGRAGWAGLWTGLAIATKQQGLFFMPLVLVLLVARDRWQDVTGPEAAPLLAPRPTRRALRFLLSFGLLLLPLLLWDSTRNQSPGFWQLSLANYGGLATHSAGFGRRWTGFLELLWYGTASPVLNRIFLSGLPLLLFYDLWQIRSWGSIRRRGPMNTGDPNQPTGRPTHRPAGRADWLLFLFILLFLMGHAWLSFQVWDRYLLGLIPFLALLLARILWLPWSILKSRWPVVEQAGSPGRWLAVGAGIVLLVLSMARPVQDAANARYPLGSNSRALQGIDQITAYLQGHAGANTTLYHRWLGTHWRFFLWDYPYDLQYWESPQALAFRAKPGHLIAFPSWQSDTEARLALAETGLELEELSRTYTPAGYPSIILYRIKPF